MDAEIYAAPRRVMEQGEPRLLVVESIRDLRRAGVAVRVLSNSTLKSRASCAAKLRADTLRTAEVNSPAILNRLGIINNKP